VIKEDVVEVFTKETLISRLCEIKNLGWVKNARAGNAGGVGNTLEDLLGIQENNLPQNLGFNTPAFMRGFCIFFTDWDYNPSVARP
jgi:hypothetical protein